jgi:hypothetical protein
MENKNLNITLDHLEQILKDHSIATVGEAMKRFETISDRDILKQQIKELLYEKSRNLKSLLVAYGLGKEAIHLSVTKQSKEQ